MTRIRTLRIGNRMFLVNGVDPLVYIDLIKAMQGKRTAVKQYKEVLKPLTNYYKLRSKQ